MKQCPIKGEPCDWNTCAKRGCAMKDAADCGQRIRQQAEEEKDAPRKVPSSEWDWSSM